jgi:hypothetical protein
MRGKKPKTEVERLDTDLLPIRAAVENPPVVSASSLRTMKIKPKAWYCNHLGCAAGGLNWATWATT